MAHRLGVMAADFPDCLGDPVGRIARVAQQRSLPQKREHFAQQSCGISSAIKCPHGNKSEAASV
jgi:hypothetical protein